MDIFTLPSFREVVELLDSFNNVERSRPNTGDFAGGSERMARLLERLGSPHAGIPAAHVAGTKGKGSVTHLAAAALGAAGLKTGYYTSPHVDSLRERIGVQGRPIGEQRFIEACVTVLREAEAMREDGDSPSYFEVLTATAFVAFKAAAVEVMVIETGLGGRLDSTNLRDLRVAAVGLTSISMDHEDILGNTLTEIAAEKAAIIRPHIPVVTLPQQTAVMEVIEKKTRECRSPLFRVGEDILVNTRREATRDKPGLGQRLDFETWRNVYPDIPLGLLGNHQAENAALALGLADLLLEYMDREPLDSLVLKRAWRGLVLPGRLEVAAEKPWHVVDGAHNPASAWVASEMITGVFSAADRTLIFGVAADKDWRTMLRVLAPLFRNVVLTPYDSPRAMETSALAAFVEQEFPGVKTASAIDPAHALDMAREMTGADGLILTTGSLYLAGAMRALLRSEKAARH